jgi:tight adherence protein B
MVSCAVLLLGLAVLSWPTGRCAGRLRRLIGPAGRSHGVPRVRLPRPTLLMVAVGATVPGFLLGGAGGALAAGLAGVTAWRRWTARRALRRTLTAVDGLAEALRSLVAELRAGAHPAAAADSAAIDAEPAAARAMRSIAAAARLDGDVDRALTASRAATPATARVLTQLSQAWIMVRRHGLALADVLDAVQHDLDTRVRFARQVLARMAGPRASATILALLPTVGIGLGEAMGAHPLRILTATTSGQLLLVTGTALACAGVAWSARITNQVVLA